jgi:hypothetical protein
MTIPLRCFSIISLAAVPSLPALALQGQMFLPPVVHAAGTQPLAIDSGDLDGDGNLDLVVGCRTQPGVLVFFGDGAGGLSAPTAYTALDDIRAVKIGDLDQDGDLDVAATAAPGALYILLNDGTGTLATAKSFGLPAGLGSLALGDLDLDGDIDACLTQWYQGEIRNMQNDGSANFNSMGTYALPLNAGSVALCDLNADGLPDAVATINYYGNGATVSVFLGKGSGQFSNGVEYPVGNSCLSTLAVADFDADGSVDLVAQHCAGCAVLMGDGAGALGPPQTISSTAWPSASGAVPITADFDGDGQADIAALVPTPGDMISIFSYDSLQGWEVDGDYAVTSGGWSFSHAADLNGDGFPDLLVSDYAGNQLSVLLHTGIDCDQNGIFDPAEIENDPGLDCDADGLLDSCQIAGDSSLDCNANGILDSCELYTDCDSDGTWDACQIAGDPSMDCDGDGALDSCQIAGDPSLDQDGDGVLDSCQCAFSNFCVSTGNSTGVPATIGWSGSASITAADLTLTGNNLPPFQFGMFFYGSDEWFPVVMGDGLLCIAPPLYRIRTVVISDSTGVASLTLDYGSKPLSSGKGQVVAFSTWRFQLWYRDPTGGPAGSNTTDGLMVTFCP